MERIDVDKANLNSYLFYCCDEGDIEQIRDALAQGADVNAINSGGWTALMMLAKSGKLTPEILFMLHEKGVRINARDKKNGKTALMVCYNLTPPLLDAFVQCGADINAMDNNRNTAVIMSTKHNHTLTPEMLESFHRHGADINGKDDVGDSPLIRMAWNKRLTPPLLRTFQKLGVDINQPNANQDWTPIMTCSFKDCLSGELLDAFLECGANPTEINRHGDTAMSVALIDGLFCCSLRSMVVLLSRGYDIHDMYEDWTPENFTENLRENYRLTNAERSAYAILAAVSLYPKKSKSITSVGMKEVNSALNIILPILEQEKTRLNSENLLHIIKNWGDGPLSLSLDSKPVMVSLLLECMESNPGLVVKFIKKRLETALEQWVQTKVKGASELVAKLVSFVNKGKNSRNSITDISF